MKLFVRRNVYFHRGTNHERRYRVTLSGVRREVSIDAWQWCAIDDLPGDDVFVRHQLTPDQLEELVGVLAEALARARRSSDFRR